MIIILFIQVLRIVRVTRINDEFLYAEVSRASGYLVQIASQVCYNEASTSVHDDDDDDDVDGCYPNDYHFACTQ